MTLSGTYRKRDGERRFIVSVALVGVVAAVITILLSRTWLVKHYELRTLDYLYRYKLSRESIGDGDDILLVEIDDTTVERLGWPLQRNYYAKLIKLLLSSGAKVIAFDIVFSDPGYSEEGDKELVDTTKGNRNVIHAAIFSEVNQSSVEDASASLKRFSLGHKAEQDMLPDINQILLPMPELLESAENLADISIEPDEDGVVRRLPLVRRYKGKLYPSLSLAAICRFLNIKREDILVSPGHQIALTEENRSTIRIPIDARGRVLVNYANPNSYKQMECSLLWLLQKFNQIAEGEKPEDMPDLQGKLVLIGKVVTGDTDQRPTPFAASFPMLRVHANVISNILQQNFLKQTPGYLGPALPIVLSLSIAFLVYLLRPIRGALISLLALISYALFSYYLFVYHNLLSPLLTPFLAILISFSSVSFHQYISEKKRMIMSLDRLSRYNESVIENMGDALVVVDATGKIVMLNKRAVEILHIKEGVAGEAYRDALSEGEEPLRELISEILDERTVFADEEIFLGEGSNRRSLEVTTSLLQGEAGENMNAIVVIRDVSELRQLQKQIQFKERLSAIGELAREVSHEMKNYLQGIRLYAEHLAEDLSPEDPRREYAEDILAWASDLGKAVARLNNYGEPLKLDLVAGVVNDVVESAMAFAADEIDKNEIKVIMDLQEALPKVTFDMMHLRDALVNLIINAAHAMPEGGTLTIQTRQRDASIEILVTDTGTGIPEDIRDSIFNPYFTTKPGIGTGLGLSIAYKNVEAQGGSIQLVEAEVGKGSTFIISLPLRREKG